MTNISKSNDNISRVYLWFYLIYVVLTTFSKFSSYYIYLHSLYEVTVLLSIVVNLAFVFLLYKVNTRFDNTSIFCSGFVMLCLIFGFITKLEIVTIPLAAIYLFIINLRRVNFHEFIKNDFRIKCYLLFIIILLYILHLCPRIAYSVAYRHGIPRLSMGFSVYAMFSSFVFCIILSYLILIGQKAYNIKVLMIISCIGLIVFLLTDTRSPFMSELLIVALLIIGRVKIIKKIVEILSIPILIIMSILSVLVPLTISVTNPSFYYWNKFFSNRLVLQQSALKFYPVKSFGYGKISLKALELFNNGNKIYIDNTYLMLILVCGVIGFIIFECLLIKSCYISVRCNNYIICIMLISLSILFVTEIYFNDINIYTPVICAFILGYSHNDNLNKMNAKNEKIK